MKIPFTDLLLNNHNSQPFQNHTISENIHLQHAEMYEIFHVTQKLKILA